MAKLIKTDGTIETVKPEGKCFSLKELQGFVHGYIEAVYSQDRKKVLWVNEEGKLMNLPFNAKATELVTSNAYCLNDVIVGDVLETDVTEVD